MWVDFKTNSNTSLDGLDPRDPLGPETLFGLGQVSSGFQLSLVSVSEDMRQVIDTVTNTYNEYNENLSRHSNTADQQLVRHIIKLLSAKVGSAETFQVTLMLVDKIK